MKKYFVPYEIAKELKELGFNEPCLAIYTNRYVGGVDTPVAIHQQEGMGISGDENSLFESPAYWWTVTAPLYDQVINWFIERYGITIWTAPTHHTWKFYIMSENSVGLIEDVCKTRYETLNGAFKRAIELVKQKK
jgi:hypothetical protein